MAVKQLSDGNSDGTVMGQSTSDLVGFYGVAPVDQAVTIATGTDATTTQAAVNSVIVALQALGLVA